MDSKKIGVFGEKIACYYLKNKGYKILDTNYVKRWTGAAKGEIDIVTKKDKTISFIEVKTISSDQGGYFLPEEKVNFQKQRKLKKLAEVWMREKKISFNSKWQIDVISIRVDTNTKKAKIRHFKNAIF